MTHQEGKCNNAKCGKEIIKAYRVKYCNDKCKEEDRRGVVQPRDGEIYDEWKLVLDFWMRHPKLTMREALVEYFKV